MNTLSQNSPNDELSPKPNMPLSNAGNSKPNPPNTIVMPSRWRSDLLLLSLFRRVTLDNYTAWLEMKGMSHNPDAFEKYRRDQHHWEAVMVTLQNRWFITITRHQIRNHNKVIYDDLSLAMEDPEHRSPPTNAYLMTEMSKHYPSISFIGGSSLRMSDALSMPNLDDKLPHLAQSLLGNSVVSGGAIDSQAYANCLLRIETRMNAIEEKLGNLVSFVMSQWQESMGTEKHDRPIEDDMDDVIHSRNKKQRS